MTGVPGVTESITAVRRLPLKNATQDGIFIIRLEVGNHVSVKLLLRFYLASLKLALDF